MSMSFLNNVTWQAEYTARETVSVFAHSKKTTKEFAPKANTEWQKIEQQELNSPTFQSNRNWTLEDLAVILPNTYQK